MASFTFISNTVSSSSYSCHIHKPLSFLNNNSTQKSILELGYQKKKKSRGLSVITRGGPSSTSYIFAFVFPLSLLAVTIFSSMRIADDLDRKFLEELAVNQAILEEEDGDGDSIALEGKPEVPRTRNRPKREVEVSSK